MSVCHAMPFFSSCSEKNVLFDVYIAALTNWMWFSVVCTPIDNGIRHYSGQKLLWTHQAHILTTVMTRIGVDRSADYAKQH